MAVGKMWIKQNLMKMVWAECAEVGGLPARPAFQTNPPIGRRFPVAAAPGVRNLRCLSLFLCQRLQNAAAG